MSPDGARVALMTQESLSLDLQRTYYIEEILRGDNFNANVLAIRWTKDF